MENAPGTLVTVTADGVVLYSNRAIDGLNPTTVPGTNVYNFVPRQHQDLFRKTLERVFQTGEAGGYEVGDTPGGTDPTLHIIRLGPGEAGRTRGLGNAAELGRYRQRPLVFWVKGPSISLSAKFSY